METSIVLNIILSGIILIILRGAYILQKEVKMLKIFSCMIFGFTEEISGKSEREIKQGFVEYMKNVNPDFKIKFGEE